MYTHPPYPCPARGGAHRHTYTHIYTHIHTRAFTRTLALSLTRVSACSLTHAYDPHMCRRAELTHKHVQTHTHQVAPKSDAEFRQTELQLKERVTKNVDRVMDRVNAAAPRVVASSTGDAGGAPRYEHRVDQIVHRLIEAAAQPERLCHMTPIYMAWL